MTVFWTKSKSVNMEHPYFAGIMFRVCGEESGSNRKVRQIRIGFVWWHCGITFIF